MIQWHCLIIPGLPTPSWPFEVVWRPWLGGAWWGNPETIGNGQCHPHAQAVSFWDVAGRKLNKATCRNSTTTVGNCSQIVQAILRILINLVVRFMLLVKRFHSIAIVSVCFSFCQWYSLAQDNAAKQDSKDQAAKKKGKKRKAMKVKKGQKVKKVKAMKVKNRKWR